MAAAGLIALDRIERLAEDHEKARTLAAGLRERGWQAGVPETNIVLMPVADLDATLHRLEASGVRAAPMAGQVRFVTHADVSDADITAALDRIGPVERAHGVNGVPGPRARLRAPVRPGGR